MTATVPLRIRAAAALELRKRQAALVPMIYQPITYSADPNPSKLLYTKAANGAITLYPHEHQKRALESTARIVAMIAGSQGGKTSFGPWWLYEEIRRLIGLGRGGGDYIAVTSSYDLFKLKMLPELRNVFEHVLGVGRYWSGDKIIELKNPVTGAFEAQRADDPMWGRIILRSASSGSGLESNTGKAAWMDEAGQDEFTLEANEAIDRRLTLNEGRKLITTTPYNLGWLKQQIVDKADSDPDIDLIQFESIANPVFPKAEFERQERLLPAWKFSMFFKGVYTRPPGMIYSDFIDEYRERGGHKVKPFELPWEWPRLVGVDPGVIHTCKVWLALSPDGLLFVYRESLGERKGAIEHAKESLEIAARNNERVIKWAVGAKSEIYHREDWIKAGATGVVEPEFADVEAGIDKVIGLLRNYQLFFFDTCKGVLDQIATYSRVLDSSGNTTDKIKDKEKYHYLDALRYVAISAPGRRKLDVTVRQYA